MAAGKGERGVIPGSICVSRVGFGVPPERTLIRRATGIRERFLEEHGRNVRKGGTPLPTRETRMLPGNLPPACPVENPVGKPGMAATFAALQMVAIAQW